MKKLFFSIPMQIALALILGIIVGLYWGNEVSFLGEFGKVVVQLIKAVAAPFLFIVILHAFITSDVDTKSGIKLFAVCGFNGLLALTIGIGVSKFFHAGEHLSRFQTLENAQLAEYANKKINFIDAIKGHFPESLMKPFLDNAVISLVLIAVFFGLALRKLHLSGREEAGKVMIFAEWLSAAQRMFEIGLTWLVHLIPLAVFGVVAKTVGQYGLEPLKGLVFYVGVGLLGIILHILIVYQGWVLFKGISLKEFWSKAKSTVIYAIGINSSLATLPMTLKTLDELKVSKKASTLGACVGTNLNNDGILLYEAMAVFFVAQASGIEMSFSQQLLAAMTCVIGTIGVAGIPEAGFITLSLVLTTVGLPVEILPMLLTVDWIVGRARSATNVLGDMVVSIALDKSRK